MSLKYPHDRVNGYVQLTDGNGKPYCPQFRFQEKPKTWWAGYSKYWNAQRILLKRLYGKKFEPSGLSNMHLLETYVYR